MTTAAAMQTIVVNENTKQFTLSDKWCAYESRPFSITLNSGNDWMAGAYTLALSFGARTMAVAGCAVGTTTLTGTLNLNTTELDQVFDWLGCKRIVCDLTLWDNTNRVAWARGRCDVWLSDYTTAGSTPTALADDYYSGTATLTADDTSKSVDLTAYALSAAPSQIFASIQTPVGGDNIWCTVTASNSTSFTCAFSGTIPASGYKMHWLIFP